MSSPRPRRPHHVLRFEMLEDRTTPAVHEWTGLGADNLWSNSQNWTNGSPTSDVSGDVDLVFHTNLTNTANLVTQNDIVGLVVDSITFDAAVGVIGPTTFAAGGTSSSGYTINGNTITIDTSAVGQGLLGIDVVTGVADATNGITQTFNAGITLATDSAIFRSQEAGSRLTFTGDIDLGLQPLTINNLAGSPQGVTISGAISNGQNLIKDGSGVLVLSGNNSYANTTVNGGTVFADSNTALGATTGIVTINDPGVIRLRNGVTIVKATLNLNSNAAGGGLGADGNTTNTFRGNVVLVGAGGVALGAGNGAANADTRLIIDGVISGATSTLFLNGAGVIEFTKNNTYTGITDINGNQGFTVVQIDAPAGLGAGGDSNRTIIRNGAVGGQPGGSVWLNFNGTLQDAAAIPEEIDFAGSGVGAAGAVRSLGNTNVIIPGNITFIAAAPWVFAVDGALGSMTLTGVIDSQGLNRALTKIGPGTLIIGGTAANVFQGGVIVNGGVLSVQNTSVTPLGLLAGPSGGLVTVNNTGTLRVEGIATVPNPVQLNTNGTLAGTGVVSGAVNSTGGIVSPGASTGILNVNSVALDANSTFRVELNGTTVDTEYDRLAVLNGVTLGNATLDITLGFTPAVNNTFIVLTKFAVGAIPDTFAGLPEGAFFSVGGTFFQISYTGNDGNDVVLTVVEGVSVTNATTNEDAQTTSGLVVSASSGITHVKVTNITNGTLFQNNGTTPIANNSFITVAQASAGLKFTPGANFFGTGSFQVQGSTSNTDAGLVGGTATATITINPVADTPSVTNATTTQNTQTTSGLVISRNVADGPEVTHVKVTNITNGTLFQNNGTTPIANGSFITFAQGNAGLKFTPNPGFSGTASFNVQASTSNTNAGLGGGVATATITVNAVGSPPAPPAPPAAPAERFAVGTGVGGQVRAYDGAGNLALNFVPFSGFAGAVRVATGDVNGDGVEDVVVGATAPNGHVKVFSGATGAELRSFFAFAGFNGDVAVGAGDVNHDGFADVIVGASAPNGHVKAFDGATGAELRSFFAFLGFNGAVTVAGGDVNHDGFADIVVGASAPNGHVKVFDGVGGAELRSFFAFPGFNAGVNVGSGDTNADGFADIIVGASTSAPHVKVFDGRGGALAQSFFALPGFPGGVTVAGGDRNGDGRADIVAGVGSLVRFFDGPTNALITEFFPFGPGFPGGIFVG